MRRTKFVHCADGVPPEFELNTNHGIATPVGTALVEFVPTLWPLLNSVRLVAEVRETRR
jgi:hypothetical protein